MKKLIFLSISIIVGILINYKNDEIVIPSDAIRVRIVANSNNIKDLYEKKKLKDEIKNDLYSLVKDAKNSDSASLMISDNIDKIEKIIENKTSDFSISYGKNYFPRKIYRGIVYDAGEYNSLVITLGKGMGENWWCVLYPPLCLIDENEITSDVEYRSYILDLLHN